jgi:hypothetical protein
MKENLEVLIIGQGLIVLLPSAEVPLLYIPMRRSEASYEAIGSNSSVASLEVLESGEVMEMMEEDEGELEETKEEEDIVRGCGVYWCG